jgi:hypothetical protein
MEKGNFREYMKQGKKPAKTIDAYVKSVEFYAGFLHSQQHVSNPGDARPVDLEKFVNLGGNQGENVYRHLWGIRTYYEFIQHADMEMKASEWMEYLQNETRKLGEFPKVDRECVKKLSAIGITTVNQLLSAGDTREKLVGLSEKSGASQVSLMELFKLSNLSRLPGLKKVRGRLFYEAGLDTLDKIAAHEPEDVHRILKDYVEKTGYEGIAPTPGEAQVTVKMARFLSEKRAY